MIDCDLKWQTHIDLVYSRLLKFTGIFYKLRYLVSTTVLKMLYFSFVHSQILYGIEVYANTCRTQLSKLCILNNKILRIIQKNHYVHLFFSSTKTIILSLFLSCMNFNCCAWCVVYKFYYCNYKLPRIFSLSIARCIHTTPDHPIISIYPELILYVEPDVWNSKPPSYGTIYLKISKKSVISAPSKTVDKLPVCRYLWVILIDVCTISLSSHKIPLTLFFYFLSIIL